MQNLKRIPLLGCLALLAYMPFHVFLSQSLSLLTGGLEEWKIAKDVVLLLLVLFTICLVFWQGSSTRTFRILLLLVAAYGALHLLVWAVHPGIYKRAAALGLTYNLRVPLFAVLGYVAYLLVPFKFAFSSVMKLVLGASTIVASFGLLQLLLPNNFLMHFGYSLQRGVMASFAIDSNPLFPRIMSTLREPNALGAYLILPAVALSVLFVQSRQHNKRLIFGGALGLHVAAILMTQSRSAWVGLVVAVVAAFLWQYQTWFIGLMRRFWYLAVAVLVVGATGIVLLRNSHFVQAYIIHTSSAHTSELDSNELHWAFVKKGLEGIADQPLGHGPGTAGLASIQNPKGSFLTENYFVQIGYEVGVLGLALFIAINVWMYRLIWRRGDAWSVVLLASFWAYVITNMLLHTWSNEAVAAQWWILAGLAAAGVATAGRSSQKHATVA